MKCLLTRSSSSPLTNITHHKVCHTVFSAESLSKALRIYTKRRLRRIQSRLPGHHTPGGDEIDSAALDTFNVRSTFLLGLIILSHFQWKSPHLINSSVCLSVCLSVTMFDQIFCTNYYGCFVLWSLSKPQFWKTEWCVWAFLLRMENGFVPRAEGPWFLECPYATFRFPFGTFVFRRNTKVEI